LYKAGTKTDFEPARKPGRTKRSTLKQSVNRRNEKQISESEEEDSSDDLSSDSDSPKRGRDRPRSKTPSKSPAKRNAPAKLLNSSYDEACEKLQLSATPDHLPCREKETKIITDFITEGLRNGGSSSSLYISGMPGTGKTATTLQVIRNLAEQQQRKKHQFVSVHINGMSLTNPHLIYSILYKSIVGKTTNPTQAALFLDDFFKKPNKKQVLQNHGIIKKGSTAKKDKEMAEDAEKVRLVLVDELDALMTKKQTLLYNLFDWPTYENSRLLVVAIANTMDLPERLQRKIASRIGNKRLVYEPYSIEQIRTILASRLAGLDVVKK